MTIENNLIPFVIATWLLVPRLAEGGLSRGETEHSLAAQIHRAEHTPCVSWKHPFTVAEKHLCTALLEIGKYKLKQQIPFLTY